MAAQPKPNDPSMEDILASIRRIIADDQAKPSAQPEAMAARDDDVLELTQDLRATPEHASEPEQDYDQNDVDLLFREIEEDQQAEAEEALIEEVLAAAEAAQEEETAAMTYAAPPVQRAAPPVYAPSEQDFAGLISPQVGASVSGAFSQLAHTVLSQNARTLDDLVQEMMKPMLKSWLDENLPTVVERLVRGEIERVARGGR